MELSIAEILPEIEKDVCEKANRGKNKTKKWMKIRGMQVKISLFDPPKIKRLNDLIKKSKNNY